MRRSGRSEKVERTVTEMWTRPEHTAWQSSGRHSCSHCSIRLPARPRSALRRRRHREPLASEFCHCGAAHAPQTPARPPRRVKTSASSASRIATPIAWSMSTWAAPAVRAPVSAAAAARRELRRGGGPGAHVARGHDACDRPRRRAGQVDVLVVEVAALLQRFDHPSLPPAVHRSARHKRRGGVGIASLESPWPAPFRARHLSQLRPTSKNADSAASAGNLGLCSLSHVPTWRADYQKYTPPPGDMMCCRSPQGFMPETAGM